MTVEEQQVVEQFENEFGIIKQKFTTGDSRVEKLEADIRLLKQKGLARMPGGGPAGEPIAEVLQPGKQFTESKEFTGWMQSSTGPRGKCVGAIDFPLSRKAATNIITGPGIAPPMQLPGIYSAAPIPPPALVAVVGARPVSTPTITYLRLASRPTPGAKSQYPEGSAKAEQSFDVAPHTTQTATIAAWTSASTQILADLTSLEIFIDSILTQETLFELDRQILYGTGAAAGQLDGIMGGAISYNTALTLTGDTPVDIVSHAATQLAATGVIATAFVVSPTDAERLRLQKTTYGDYVLESGTSGVLPNLWGLRPVVDWNLAAGNFLVGRFTPDSVELLDQMQAAVEISREHSDYFTKNLCALRAELRAALGLYNPSAFVKGTFPPPTATMETSSAHAQNHPRK